MSERPAGAGDPGGDLLDLYDRGLAQVYGYLLARCGQVALAEDLTAQTFLAAAAAVHRPDPPRISMPWVIGVARHKLVDHWRRQAREDRSLRTVVAHDGVEGDVDDPWEARLDAVRAHETLARLAPQHRAALALRYLDDLPVPEVAALLERTVHATEALLVRARAAFRRAYGEDER